MLSVDVLFCRRSGKGSIGRGSCYQKEVTGTGKLYCTAGDQSMGMCVRSKKIVD